MSEVITSATLAKPFLAMSWAVIVVIGAGPSTSARGMREPVTMTACSLVADAWSGPSCAGGVADVDRDDGGTSGPLPLTITIAPETS